MRTFLGLFLSFQVSRSLICQPNNDPNSKFLSCWDDDDPLAKGEFYENTDDHDTWYRVFLTEQMNSMGSQCLDGSPGYYYVRPGFGNGTNSAYCFIH